MDSTIYIFPVLWLILSIIVLLRIWLEKSYSDKIMNLFPYLEIEALRGYLGVLEQVKMYDAFVFWRPIPSAEYYKHLKESGVIQAAEALKLKAEEWRDYGA